MIKSLLSAAQLQVLEDAMEKVSSTGNFRVVLMFGAHSHKLVSLDYYGVFKPEFRALLDDWAKHRRFSYLVDEFDTTLEEWLSALILAAPEDMVLEYILRDDEAFELFGGCQITLMDSKRPIRGCIEISGCCM